MFMGELLPATHEKSNVLLELNLESKIILHPLHLPFTNSEHHVPFPFRNSRLRSPAPFPFTNSRFFIHYLWLHCTGPKLDIRGRFTVTAN